MVAWGGEKSIIFMIFDDINGPAIERDLITNLVRAMAIIYPLKLFKLLKSLFMIVCIILRVVER